MASSPIFSEVNAQYAKTSLFNLSFENKLTTTWFRITPFLCKEVLPGDTARVNTEMLVRLAPMFAPVMHRIRVYTHFFFVPYRLLWDNWETFITQSLDGTYDPNASIPKTLPTVTLPSMTKDETPDLWEDFVESGTLADYLGLQFKIAGFGTDAVDGTIPSATFQYLPFLAYQKVWNDYYRDENLEEEDFVPAVDGNHSYMSGDSTDSDLVDDELSRVRYRSWKKDYFTSALPWTQKGPDIELPIGGTAPVSDFVFKEVYSLSGTTKGGDIRLRGSAGVETSYAQWLPADSAGIDAVLGMTNPNGSQYEAYANGQSLSGTVYVNKRISGQTVDLSQATPTTINELRLAVALQRWEELNARGGTRYVEQLAAHFGVRPRDSRLQRAEYLGGGVSDVVISEVLQTSASSIDGSTTPQGQMAGHGLSATQNHGFKRYFDEHGVLLGVLTVMPDANYYQGAQRMYLKRGVYDFAWPTLANLGEQPIYAEEIFNNGIPLDVENESQVFGYTPRYAEYKFSNDEIHGEFRTSLSNWHAGRLFGSVPKLNSSFINGHDFDPQIFAVSDTISDPFWIQMYNDIKMSRKLPKFGTPSLI